MELYTSSIWIRPSEMNPRKETVEERNTFLHLNKEVMLQQVMENLTKMLLVRLRVQGEDENIV